MTPGGRSHKGYDLTTLYGLQTSRLVRRVATDLARCGLRLERVLSDNGAEFKGPVTNTLNELQARHTRIRSGRPFLALELAPGRLAAELIDLISAGPAQLVAAMAGLEAFGIDPDRALAGIVCECRRSMTARP